MPEPAVAASVSELLDVLRGALSVAGARVRIDDIAAFRSRGIRDLAWTATFSADPATVEVARWLVWEASLQLEAPSASIHELYMARGRGEVGGFTVPAINLRTQAFELARSEQEYTFQRPGELLTNVLAGAIAADWHGPVFVQGDHFQFNAKKYAADPAAVTDGLRRLTVEALGAGYGNIDIDSSTLVDLSLAAVDEQQHTNYTRAAELTALIREREPAGQTTSVGGEIGEVGKENSTEAELRTYLDGYRAALTGLAGPAAVGISKVSVQTGTSHGGIPLPDGTVAPVKLDFGTLERLGHVARQYGLAGAVQHGASTLPDELFHRFPTVETAEIHLATGFQNLLYEHPAFPAEFLDEIHAWCDANCADERTAGQDEAQFLYKTRKKALGPFKRRLWELPGREAILATQEAKIGFLMEQLKVPGTAEVVHRYIRPVATSRPAPAAVTAVAV